MTRAKTLAVSNIAWEAAEEAAVAARLASEGVRAVEIAPTKVFADPTRVPDSDLDAYVAFWADHGIEVVAFQSMLFGRPDLAIFGDHDVRRATIERLVQFVDLAGRMGVGALVFGSPRNRLLPPGGSEESCWSIAVDVFGEIGRAARAAGTVFCLEPNPPQYGCDFITTAASGERLVREVDEPGFRLHLDAAGMTLAGDDVGASIRSASEILCHYHVSAPQLAPVEATEVDHTAAFDALRGIGYEGHVSIEMRGIDDGNAPARVAEAVALTRRLALAAGLEL
jgi:sugar phosphate isomerase/epimerase